MNNTVTAVIVDDEKLARQRIRELLKNNKEVTLVAECSSGQQAVTEILRRKPDLVFLDVEMPELNGLEVIDCIGIEAMPVIIFVTAYDHYAVQAFEVHAVDYLLKPFDRQRFDDALRRALNEISLRRAAPTQEKVDSLLNQLRKDNKLARRILVKSGGRVTILDAETIDWAESAGNYVQLHCGKEKHLIRETMARLEERLDPWRFVRVHRTAIVNIDRIREIEPHFQGNAVIILKDGQKVPLSRSQRPRLNQILESRS